ncbi:MAG: hypothetical protein HFH26_15020 [Clostridiaceae bacterium]|nr:hypothetical protein [Clostridiaceae bacterium]
MCFHRCPIGLGLFLFGIGILVGGVIPYLLAKWALAIALIIAGVILLKSCC